MKRKGLACIAAILLSITQASAIEETNGLRIMSYNIRNCIGMDERVDLHRTAAVIDSLDADVVAIQEVDSVTSRSQGRDILKELGALTGMGHRFAPAIEFDGGKYGIGILFKKTPAGYKQIALPGREESRTMLIAEFDDYVFACTHLSLTEEDRSASAELIRQESAKYDKPFIIAGDLNSCPEDDFTAGFCRNFTIISPTKGATYPADNPTDLIDYIAIENSFADKIRIEKREIVNQPTASDHRPIIVEIKPVWF